MNAERNALKNLPYFINIVAKKLAHNHTPVQAIKIASQQVSSPVKKKEKEILLDQDDLNMTWVRDLPNILWIKVPIQVPFIDVDSSGTCRVMVPIGEQVSIHSLVYVSAVRALDELADMNKNVFETQKKHLIYACDIATVLFVKTHDHEMPINMICSKNDWQFETQRFPGSVNSLSQAAAFAKKIVQHMNSFSVK